MTTIRVPFEHPVTGEEMFAVCEVSGRYYPATFNEPASSPDVDVITVYDADTCEREDALEAIRDDDALRISIEEAGLEMLADESEDPEPDYEADFNDAREYD